MVEFDKAEQRRLFSGWGTVSIVDRQNDYIDVLKEFRDAGVMEKMMERGAPVIDSHQNHVVGRIISYDYKIAPSGRPGLYLTAEIFKNYPSDDDVWQSILNKEYTGFSLGGKAQNKDSVCTIDGCHNNLTGIESWEWSIVSTPANQEAVIDSVNKLAKSLKFSKDDAKRIGDKLNIDWDKINIDEFIVGFQIELEHGLKNLSTNITDNNEILTAKIALAHLLEFPNYYSKKEGLPKLENQLQKIHVYVKTPSEAPVGVQVHTGEKGGHYYETEEIENRSKREEIERQQKTPKINIKSLKEVIGEKDYNNMDKYEVTRELKDLLNTYSKISIGTASDAEINKSFEIIKKGLPDIYNFYHFIGDKPSNEFEVKHKKVSDNIEKLQTIFNNAKDRKDKSIAIDNFINTAHVFGDNIILRLWRNFDTWSKDISSFMDVPQIYLDYLKNNIGKSLLKKIEIKKYIRQCGDQWCVYSESGKILGTHPTKEDANQQLRAIEVNKGIKSFLTHVGKVTGNFLDSLADYEVDEWVETHWKPNSKPDSSWNEQIKQLWRNKDREYKTIIVHKAKVYVKTPSEAPPNVKLQEGKRGGHYYESQESTLNNTKSPNKVSNVSNSESGDNIEIITGDIKDEHILDSLETFSKEGSIEAVPPPTKEEVQYWIKESGIPKDRKVVVIPFFSETVNGYNYMGEDTIYLMSNNLELDKEILEETRAELFKVGYNIEDCTFENRRIGTLTHEEGHIQTYKKAGITASSKKDAERLHYTFNEYEELIMKHFEKDQDMIFDYEVLLELIAEDFRISHGGKAGAFAHRYFYIDDKKDQSFQEKRLNILRKMGMIK